jgi:diguanylate cyclase (GGDEF)-like protein/PAS domain S-box-containing protein
VQEVLQGKRNSYVLEKRYQRKDGGTVWAYLAVALLRDEARQARYFISVVSSINEQKQAIVQLEESRTRLKTVFDSLTEAVFVYNAAGDVVDANRAALRMFGYVDISEAGARIMELDRRFEARTLDGELLSLSEWPLSRILRGERIANVELNIKQISTGRRWVASFGGARVDDGTGTPVLAVLTIRDISKRHYAQALLRQSEQRFRTAFDHIPDMVVLYDRSLRIRYANHAMAQAMKTPASALVGKTDRELHGIPLADLRRPLLLAALETGCVQEAEFELASRQGTRHLAATCVPLLDAKRHVDELMCLYHDYTERKHAEEKARQAALHDPLTRLPNRALLFEYARHVLGAARRRREKVAVLFIDLDRFKPINDLHGHEAGDDVLRQVAQRINAAVRDEDMVFRLGGDEFLVLVSRIAEAGATGELLDHLLGAISRPYHVGPLALTLSASIGVSLYPDHGDEIDLLINHADAAMYRAKESGRNAHALYEPWMSDQAGKQAVIEQDLKRAIAHNEFRLYYQPVIDMHSGRVVSLEALIRWPGNSNSADRFVPIAEATGLIGAVGDWVLAEACRQHAEWQRAGMQPAPIAINVSPVQFRRQDLAEHIEAMLREHCIDSSAIHLELTETAVMDDIDRAIDVLGKLRACGIRIALDDFGTGYSSLNYLSRLPLDKLKIDQTFVQRIEADSAGRAITEAIIVLGRTLGLTVVAEGVESAAVMTYLRERGCHEAQGYVICKPLAGDALPDWVRKRSGRD